MAKTILAYGDSNTHGTPPMTDRMVYARYGADVRWPTLLGRSLQPDWQVIEAGLPGRTAAHDCPVMGTHRNGQVGLRIALESHGPIDLLTIMLGTNDSKTFFGLSADGIAAGLASLLAIAQSDEYQTRHGGLRFC
uniref:GDSL-type esterase/lipase family protein n=1 Tax=Yoonia rhodophyticola TaxID=3137370 RepID=A0AAN0NLC3_9RHOB